MGCNEALGVDVTKGNIKSENFLKKNGFEEIDKETWYKSLK
jgi:hypothetical protein